VNADQIRKLKALSQCSFQGTSAENHFVPAMLKQLEKEPEKELTEKQAQFIEILWFKYRRQLGHHDPRPVGYVTPQESYRQWQDQRRLDEAKKAAESLKTYAVPKSPNQPELPNLGN
jgi:hypothetical protein